MAVYYPIGHTRISLTNPQASTVRAGDSFKSFTVTDNDVLLEASTTLKNVPYSQPWKGQALCPRLHTMLAIAHSLVLGEHLPRCQSNSLPKNLELVLETKTDERASVGSTTEPAI